MTAGQDKTIRLFEIDGENNPKAQGVFFNDMPILHAAFTPDGSQIIASGRRKYFYSFDLNQVIKALFLFSPFSSFLLLFTFLFFSWAVLLPKPRMVGLG